LRTVRIRGALDDLGTELLRPHASEAMTAYPVSTRVNSPKNDDAAIIEPLAYEA
jgi:putative SOS response-associated peptidase YedK